MQAAANAARWGSDWHAVLGLGPGDRGTLIERVCANVVLECALHDHNAAVRDG